MGRCCTVGRDSVLSGFQVSWDKASHPVSVRTLVLFSSVWCYIVGPTSFIRGGWVFFRIVSTTANCTTGYVLLQSFLEVRAVKLHWYKLQVPPENFHRSGGLWDSQGCAPWASVSMMGDHCHMSTLASIKIVRVPAGPGHSTFPILGANIIHHYAWVCLTHFTKTSLSFQANSHPLPSSWTRAPSDLLILVNKSFPSECYSH